MQTNIYLEISSLFSEICPCVFCGYVPVHGSALADSTQGQIPENEDDILRHMLVFKLYIVWYTIVCKYDRHYTF